MATNFLIEALGYLESGKFISPTRAQRLPASELSFALRHIDEACHELAAQSEYCGFHGTYVLQEKPGSPAVPVVYVFEAESDHTARKIHRMVWNQNLVPFIIVTSPSTIRVYPGFAYISDRDNPLRAFAVSSLADILSQLPGFDSESIDSGRIWKNWGHAADPTQRVDEKLLRDLMSLDRLLQNQGMLREASHGLIGKFVYLYYLRHRHILSNRKFEKWGIDPADLFSRHATLKAFTAVDDQLQAWLNGAVFQLADDALMNLTQAQLQMVAGVFCGDSPNGELHLAFQAYDFSHIPIETLSCVYEQFLHDNEDEDGQSRGKRLGAYYTPIPLADYVIAELNSKRPLKEGMRVLDPACGSGTFLVECYRRLIEKKIRSEGRNLNPSELRALLTKHIFGIDRDDDACRIAELSLILTLLDYVEPPDLENTNFKLPVLREVNIFKDDFFDLNGNWHAKFRDESFDWIVGNPPWSEVKGKPDIDHEHFHAWKWITEHKATNPTGGNQIAEAFLWKVGDHLCGTGVSGLVVPAMTWFKKESAAFRNKFFSGREVWCLANFANMAYVLFAQRAESPASAVFFRAKLPTTDNTILTFAPFVAEQVANRPQRANKRKITWNIVVNGAEVREIDHQSAVEGNGLTWKLAMWGSHRDDRLLTRLQHGLPTLEQFCLDSDLLVSEGAQLKKFSPNLANQLEARPDLIGKAKVNFKKLRSVGRVFSFPPMALARISKEEAYVRKHGGFAGLEVSEPPLLIVDASRRFAVFSSDFMLVPQRQVGIATKGDSKLDRKRILRLMALYLSSDFCKYHQFLMSPQWGIGMNLADIDTLKKLPVPLKELGEAEEKEWVELHRELTSLSDKRFGGADSQEDNEENFQRLLAELNSRVFKVLRVRSTERCLVEDFVNLNLDLNKGKVTRRILQAPTTSEQRAYLSTLRDCLDRFLGSSREIKHKLELVVDREVGLFSVSLIKTSATIAPSIHADNGGTALMSWRDRLRQKHSQWIYFDRNLKIYDRGLLYQFKPMQRLHWTRRQAVLDSDDIIAETLSQEDTNGR